MHFNSLSFIIVFFIVLRYDNYFRLVLFPVMWIIFIFTFIVSFFRFLWPFPSIIQLLLQFLEKWLQVKAVCVCIYISCTVSLTRRSTPPLHHTRPPSRARSSTHTIIPLESPSPQPPTTQPHTRTPPHNPQGRDGSPWTMRTLRRPCHDLFWAVAVPGGSGARYPGVYCAMLHLALWYMLAFGVGRGWGGDEGKWREGKETKDEKRDRWIAG